MTALAVAAVLAASASASASATPTPGSTQLPRGLQPTDVTPGVAGFLATAFVVVLSIFLILNLVSRMRRIRHRAVLEEARERAAADGAELEGPGAGGRGAAPSLGEGHPVVVGESREGGLSDGAPGAASEGGASRAEPDGPGHVWRTSS